MYRHCNGRYLRKLATIQLRRHGGDWWLAGSTTTQRHAGRRRRFNEEGRHVIEVVNKKPLAVKPGSLTRSCRTMALQLRLLGRLGRVEIRFRVPTAPELSDTTDLLEQHVAEQTPGSGSKVADLTQTFQLAESAKATWSRSCHRRSALAARKLSPPSRTNTVASNVEQLRVQLAEAEAEGQAEAAQAPMTQKVAHSRESVCLLLFFECTKRALSYADDFESYGVIECRRKLQVLILSNWADSGEMQIDQTDLDMQAGADTHIVRISCGGDGESHGRQARCSVWWPAGRSAGSNIWLWFEAQNRAVASRLPLSR